jgi:SAM-dependent methyltransferase
VPIDSIVENELVEDEFSVWRLAQHREFGYSDGASSERYLQKVFSRARDLGTRSSELETYIKDWPSEYHLSVKRAQLLSGFSFDRSLRVLEVGCGCGAITRHLGESFDHVVSVEGNINRARLARARTRDLDSVSVICAPFQELRFSQKFDVVFCIGVFEYSAAFIGGADPYDAALRYFADMLSPSGMVVIAIENQFGLKYFACAREDHLGVMFEGIEGYHRHPGKVRTFGKAELTMRLRKYFSQVEFFYPYPDYKVPDCVLSHEFLTSGRAGELVAHMRSRDYSGRPRVFWDEMPANLELNRNGMLDFFANSFLVFAGRASMQGVKFGQLGIVFSSGRKAAYATRTRILPDGAGGMRVEKRRIQDGPLPDEAPVALVETDTPWIGDGMSILTLVLLNAYSAKLPLEKIFEPCRIWLKLMQDEAFIADGLAWVDGSHIDSIWGNAYIVSDECRIIDREWVWAERIRLNTLLIRAIYDFLCRIETGTGWSSSLARWRGRSQIEAIAQALGVRLAAADFDEFMRIEARLAETVSGSNASMESARIRWFLAHRPTRRMMRRTLPAVRDLLSRVHSRLPTGRGLGMRSARS